MKTPCLPDPDLLSEKDLRSGLGLNSLGKKFYYYPRLESTNDRACLLAEKGEDEGTVVIADEQTRGRGRRGRRWLSPPGEGVLMSLILRPLLPPARAGRLNLLSAVAIASGLEKASGLKIGLKWPNDLIAAGRKVGGVLIEGRAGARKLDFFILGVGINVNTSSFPPGLENRAASLRQLAGRKFSRREILAAVLGELGEFYLASNWKRDFKTVLDLYRERSMILGKTVEVSARGSFFSARALDVTEDGELLVEKAGRGMIKLWHEEVSVQAPLAESASSFSEASSSE